MIGYYDRRFHSYAQFFPLLRLGIDSYRITFLKKPTDTLIFPNVFFQETLHVSGSSSAHSSGVFHCTFGTGICHASLMTAFKQVHPGRA